MSTFAREFESLGYAKDNEEAHFGLYDDHAPADFRSCGGDRGS